MGVYLNPSTKEFTDKIPKKTFVDQTELLALVAEKINDTDQKYIAVSRPRRFGKTVDANMIVAFFEKNGDKKQFDGLKISGYEDVLASHQGKHHVIKIDISKKIERYGTIKEYTSVLEKMIAWEILKVFSIKGLPKEAALVDMLEEIYAEKDEQFIFVIDEWDAPLRLMKHDQKGQVYYIAWLNTLFESQDYLALPRKAGELRREHPLRRDQLREDGLGKSRIQGAYLCHRADVD